MTKLHEGMRPDDLKGMVKGEVLVDQYESKIDETAIVVAFQVNELTAANDLNRFIQKSYVEILDTEVSAAPGQDGYYLVFVELPPGDKLPEGIAALCGDVSSLCMVENWVISARGQEPSGAMDQSGVEDFLKQYFRTDISEFFQNSNVETLTLTGDVLSLDERANFHIIDFGEIKQVLQRNNLYTTKIDESAQTLLETHHMRAVLGEGWNIDRLGDCYLIYQEDGEKSLLLSDPKFA